MSRLFLLLAVGLLAAALPPPRKTGRPEALLEIARACVIATDAGALPIHWGSGSITREGPTRWRVVFTEAPAAVFVDTTRPCGAPAQAPDAQTGAERVVTVARDCARADGVRGGLDEPLITFHRASERTRWTVLFAEPKAAQIPSGYEVVVDPVKGTCAPSLRD